MGHTNYLIKYVSSIDRQVKYDYLSPNASRVKSGNKYTSNKASYFIEDGYLYLDSRTLKNVSVMALFEDPIEVYTFEGSCGAIMSCVDYNDIEFPFDSAMIESLIKICVNELIGVFLRMKEDKDNNSKDDNINNERLS
jgi:hypothetical protein